MPPPRSARGLRSVFLRPPCPATPAASLQTRPPFCDGARGWARLEGSEDLRDSQG